MGRRGEWPGGNLVTLEILLALTSPPQATWQNDASKDARVL